MRATQPGYFADMLTEKVTDPFGEILLGDCKLTSSAVTPSADAMTSLKAVAQSVVMEHGNKPPTTELLSMEAGVKYTTAMSAGTTCPCSPSTSDASAAAAGPASASSSFVLVCNATVAAATQRGGVEELYLQARCIYCNCVVFVKSEITPPLPTPPLPCPPSPPLPNPPASPPPALFSSAAAATTEAAAGSSNRGSSSNHQLAAPAVPPWTQTKTARAWNVRGRGQAGSTLRQRYPGCRQRRRRHSRCHSRRSRRRSRRCRHGRQRAHHGRLQQQ